MSQIKIDDLTFSYPSSFDTIFDHVSFQIDTNWKLGFVGRNGRGKTTLLRLLLGDYEYSGKIISSVPFEYFPFPVADPDRTAAEVLQKICPLAEEWELIRELSYLDVEDSALERSFATLSHGEQTKLLLAALFLREGHFPLIDEPTNHLDALGREKVAAYLRRKKGFILVSHDRCFLDGCVDHILSFNRSSIEVQSGNFSSWMTGFEQRQASERMQNDRLRKDISRLQQASKRTCTWSDRVEASKIGAADKGYVGHKAAKMMKRAKSLEQRQQKAIEEKASLLRDAETTDRLKISPLQDRRGPLVSFSDVSICYGEKVICQPVSFTIDPGERVFLNGKNGSGKSSLLKLLLGQPVPYAGQVRISSGLVISYVPQDTSQLRGTLANFAAAHQIEESLFKAILRKMDLSRIQFDKDMQDFSAGQKKKVLLAKSLCEPAHLYVWDEPLNYIDLYSRIQIEQLIQEFSPTMLLVEHDRAFRDATATKVVTL